MRQSLNTAPAIREYHDKAFTFKRLINITFGLNLYLYNANLYGFDYVFKKWLKRKGIKDLDKHMVKIEKDFNPLDLYRSRGIRDYVIVNR